MENFIVSARKYRPATFASVVGQESIVRTLKNSIRNNQLAQAFLFTGPRGVGKTTTARIMAKTINCTNITEDYEACNECDSCRAFNDSASFNIHELDAASNNSVEDIRSLVEQVRIPPQSGKYKVYIIDEVHMLSQAAFNAFLKTLEEPPAYAKFILATTEKHKIIPTILSRCQIYDFKRISIADIAKHLAYIARQESIDAEEDALHVIAQKADGALRDALSLFDQIVSFSGGKLTYLNVIENLNVLDYEYYFKLTGAILQKDVVRALMIVNEIIQNGFDGQHFLGGLGQHLRNLLVSKDPETVQLLEVGKNVKARYLEQSKQLTTSFLIKALSINNDFDLQYKASNNKTLHLELDVLRLIALSGMPEDKETVVLPRREKGKNLSAATVEEKKTPLAEKKAASPESPPRQEESRTETPQTLAGKDSGKMAAETPKTPPERQGKQELQEEKPPAKSAHPEVQEPASPPYHKEDDEQAKKAGPAAGMLDLLGMGFDKKTEKTEPAEAPKEIRNAPVDEAAIQQAVDKYAEEIKENKFLYSTLKAYPVKLQGTEVVFSLDNDVQQKALNEKKSDLLLFLDKELNNNSLSISEKIVEETGKVDRRALTNDEKLAEMRKINPDLDLFMGQLKLRLED